jgi:chemotaxis protein MotB
MKREGKLKKWVICSVLFILLFSQLIFSDASQIGTTANNFLKILPPAKPAALGESYIATGDDINSIFYNPAGLGKSMLGEVSFTDIEWFQSLRYLNASLLLPFDFGNMAFALNYMSVPAMDKTIVNAGDPSGNGYSVLGQFLPYSFSGIISYATEFAKDFYIGTNVKILDYSIDPSVSNGSAFSLMADVGLDYDISLLPGLTAGLLFKNVGFETKYISQPFMQPITAKFGLGYSNNYFSFETDVEYVNDNDINYSLGGGFTIFDILSLRGGWKGGTISQFTAGAGIKYSGFAFDYAYVPYTTDGLGMTNRFTISHTFGSPDVKLRMNPRVFSPNKDKFLDFTFAISKAASPGKIKKAYITIYNTISDMPVKAMIPVRNWSQIYWNGYNDFKQLCPDGTYRAVLYVDYGNGIISASNAAYVDLDNTPPQVDGDANPKIIKPGTMTTLVVPVSFNEMASDKHGISAWKLIIGTIDGKIFKTYSGKGEPMPVTWDGSDDTGLRSVTTKTNYTYTFYAMDTVGNWGRSVTREVKVLPKEIVITLSSDTLFDIGKADVKISVYKDLKSIADQIKSNGSPKITVEGHTDNIPMKLGKYTDNMALSQARAEAVVKFFVELFNMDPSIFTAVGKGDTVPVDTNLTPEGRKNNRRVTMRIQASKFE